MPIWDVPSKLPYALFVAGDARLGEDARPALNRVLEMLAKGPPPVVDLRAWIAEHGKMGTLPIEALRAQLPSETIADLGGDAAEDRRLRAATNAMLIAAGEGAALDARAPWGLLVLATTMAGASGGVVYDSGTLRIVPRWILENPLDGFMLGSIKNHVTILSSTDATGLQHTTTLGLNKYGLFELQLSGIPATAGNIGLLLAGLAQAVVDARPATPGTWEVPAEFDVTRHHAAHAFGTELEKGSGKTRLAIAPAQGEDEGVYWNVAAPGGELDEASVREAIVALGIAAGEDEAVSAALAQATRIARNRLGEARDAFARRALTQDVVLVKKAFDTSDAGTQYLWLRVEDWNRAQLSAILTSAAPAGANLGIGDRITLADDEIVDWRVERRSGESIGNFSAEALRHVNED
jgi:uncharacterized protein YegJ (DUF2314 family)